MALVASVRSVIIVKIEVYEGNINHLYRDTKGICTVGIGHAILSENAIKSIDLTTDAGIAATPDQKIDEYRAVMKLPAGLAAGKYKDRCKLTIDGPPITRLRDSDISGFYTDLRSIYSKSKGYKTNFDDFPPGVQIGLFDLMFNLGKLKLLKFSNMNDAIREENWEVAATESHRGGKVPADRNNFVKNQFLSAIK